MLYIIEAAGWPIWLLVATSIVTLAIIVERLYALREGRILPPGLPEQVLELMRRQQDQAEAILRLARQCPMGRVLAEVAAHRDEPDAVRIDAVEDVGKDIAWRLNRYLPALATVSVVAPLLGLFGTVVGMIEIFAAYTPGSDDPARLAHGISMALYNTGFGILIAIPALIFHRYFRSRVDYYLHTMEREAGVLNRLIRQRRQP